MSVPAKIASAPQMIQESEYSSFCKYLEELCGITLGSNKSYLINSRLKPVMEEFGLNNVTEIINGLKNNHIRDLRLKVIDAMTTNETSWFRDTYPFDILKDELLPGLTKQGNKLRIWSAACSYGHEPYSLSIAIQEYLDRNPGQFNAGIEIVGTDISRRVLDEARDARYEELNLSRGLSSERRKRFFTESDGGASLNNTIKNRVRFQELNLLESYALLGRFEIVLCRNVLIYFSNENKSRILHKIAALMPKDGILFLGASEPIVNYSDDFEMISKSRGVFYQRK